MSQPVNVPAGFVVTKTRQELDWETLFNGNPHILENYSATLESMLKNLKTTAKKRGVELTIAVNPETSAIWIQAQQPATQPVAKPATKTRTRSNVSAKRTKRSK